MEVIHDGVKLRIARKSKGLTARAASEAIGVSLATLKRWESGRGVPSPNSLRDIVVRWGMPPDVLHQEPIGDCDARRRRAWSFERGETRPILRLIRSRRRRNSLTLEEISQCTGIAVPSLHRYETGTRVPCPEILRKIAGAVGCSSGEAALMDEKVFGGGLPDRSDSELSSEFLVEGSLAQARLFAKIDRLLRQGLSANEEIWEVMHSLFLMGDPATLLELWPDMKSQACCAEFNDELKLLCRSTLTLARVNMHGRGKAVAGHYRFQVADLQQLPMGRHQAISAMHLMLVALYLGDIEGAMSLLSRFDREVEKSNVTSGSTFIGRMYRSLLDFHSGSPSHALSETKSLKREARGALEYYTANVAELSMYYSLNELDLAIETLADCRRQESAFGVGSPLATRIARQITIARPAA